MDNIDHINLTCPSCGNNKFDLEKQCICGYNADESFITEAFITRTKRVNHDGTKVKALTKEANAKNRQTADGHVIKEINSWVFTFSQGDNCITLGTPALQSFRLPLTAEDLEGLLEYLYRATGKDKTIRKLQVADQALPYLIERIHTLIEQKKSKLTLTFEKSDLQEIAALINRTLKA
jgi:hypothetical protein